MTTWLEEVNLKGIYEGESFLINVDGDGTINSITWDATVPNGSSLIVQTSISWDNYEWSEWKICANGGQIPDLKANVAIHNLYFKYRVLLQNVSHNSVSSFKSLTLNFEPIVVIDNTGVNYCNPEIWIKKVGAGSFKIINTSNNNETFAFENLINQEEIYVNNEVHDIETSIPMTYRYENFNDNFLSIPTGVNILRIQGTGNFKFRYQFKL